MEHARPPAELCLEGGPVCRAESWRKWHKQFCIFLKASGVDKEMPDLKASLLLNLIGQEGYDVYTTFKFAKDENKDCFDTLVKKYNEHFGTKRNTTMARFKFFTRNQEQGEPIDDYVTALKLLTQYCEFEHLEDGLVRDRIVCGVRDSTLRDRLLRTDDLTLDRAVKICQANEMCTEEQQQIEVIKTGNDSGENASAMAVDALYAGRGGRRSAPRGTAIARAPCGVARARAPGGRAWSGSVRRTSDQADVVCVACGGAKCNGNRCPANRAMCFSCSERGHFRKMCPKLRRRVFHINADVRDSGVDGEELYHITTISEDRDSNSTKWYETLTLSHNGSKELFKLDSGSDLNVISLKTYKKLGLSVEDLNSDTTRAQSFCGNYIPILGSTFIECIYKSVAYKLHFMITDFDCQSVLGKNACENMGMIRRVFSLNIESYGDLFQGLGKLPGKYHIVTERNAQPSVCPVRKIPLGVRDKLKCELERMIKMGVIRKVTHPTPWVNAIVVAAKKDGSLRVCLDPRPLNRVVRRAHYPLPMLTEIATKLEGAQVFSKLDARSGFWMVALDEPSADLCNFGTPFGRFQYLRLPYGINCASEVFHSKIRQLLEDLEGVDSFVDDIIVWGSDKSQHDERLKKLLERAREIGIRFNKEKCVFCVSQVSYLGHTFSAGGMSIDKNKIKAIENMPVPSDRPSLERFLGMINYLSKFIPNYSELATPLRSLLKKDAAWVWHGAHDEAVRRLKACVCGAPVLALYSARAPVLLSVDASSRALGAVLMQGGRPVEYASATLTDAQCRYAQIEKELLAIVFALERFHQYVYGRGDVTVESDHKPLEALFKKSLDSIPARLQRMMLRIQCYDFTVVYKPGKYLFLADALSRAPLSDTMSEKVSVEVDEQSCFLIQNVRFSDTKMQLIKKAMKDDAECQLVIKYIRDGWPANKYDLDERVRQLWSLKESLEYVDGIIFKDNLVYIPQSLRAEMLSRVHEGHMGVDRCKRHARDVMFWPGMARDVEATVRRCGACAARAHRPAREPLLPDAIPHLPWIKVGSDIFQHAENVAWEIVASLREDVISRKETMQLDWYRNDPLIFCSSSASELISRRGVFSRRQYGSVEQLSSTGEAGGAVDAVARRYRLENGNSLGEKDELFGPPSAPVLENPEFQTRWYFKYFLGKMHQNYIGVDGCREPYLLSVVQEGGAGLLRAILFNKMGAHKIYLPPSAWSGNTSGGQAPSRPTIKQILAQFPAMERLDKVPREITCAELQKDILLLEEQEGSVNFKIGVMLMKPGQKTDDEMLSNEKGDEKWDRFISLLGDKIRLRGWNRFRGGLDVKGDMTGSHSIYTMHQGHEIMFHVSTMLPFSKDNKQQLERKRHIGNDIVNIVFTDDSVHNTFNPQCVKSHFTHIFAVVSEVEGEGYKLSVYSDDTVPPFGPSLPCPPVFNDPQLFREFLLVKLMNGEKAAFQTPTFALKRQRTLDTLIRDIYAEHCSDHKVPMLSRRALSDVWSGGAGTAGAGAVRTEHFLHVGQALKLDAVLRGDAPTSLVSSGCGGSRRAPWEGRVWRAAPLPATPICAEQLAEGRLLLSTTSNTYILEESGTTRVILRWEGCVRAARVSERAGLFRVGARMFPGGGSTTGGAGGAGLYALPIQELCAGAWAMRPLQDCKHARLPRTKTALYFDLLENGEGGKTTLAVAIGRRVMLMVEEAKNDSEMGFEYTHIRDIQLCETPILIKLMDGEVGIIVIGYKHHWEILESTTGQSVKRADNLEDFSFFRRGTLVNALRIGDERDGQIVLCYNHTCHFERLTSKGLENDGEYDFHWTTVPAAIVCAFPYIMAFAEDLLEIRLVANGSLVHAACIPGLKLLCGRRDIFYVACAPEYVPLSREIDPCLSLHDELVRQMSKQCAPYSLDEDESNENNQHKCIAPSENNSASSRSSSISSEQENIRPPLQRMAPISPPASPLVLPENSGRCVRIYKIPQSNLSAGAYQRQSVSADQVVTSYFSDRPNSIKQKLAELRLDSKSRGGGDDETL